MDEELQETCNFILALLCVTVMVLEFGFAHHIWWSNRSSGAKSGRSGGGEKKKQTHVDKCGGDDDTGAELLEDNEKERELLGKDIVEEYGGKNTYRVVFNVSISFCKISPFRLIHCSIDFISRALKSHTYLARWWP